MPVEYQDYDSKEAEHADMVADNRIAEFSEMDTELLNELLQELEAEGFDMELTGFSFEDLEREIEELAPREDTPFNHIDNLIDENFIEKEEENIKEIFGMTFTFPIEHKEKLQEYIREHGKETIVEHILALVGGE